MKKDQILNSFQLLSMKSYSTLGYSSDQANYLLGIIVAVRNICKAAEAQDTILMHKHMGKAAWFLANFCTTNNILLAKIAEEDYDEMDNEMLVYDLEDFIKQLQDELSFIKDRSDEDKYNFIKKCWVTIFPPDYHYQFMKIERILNQTIEDEKIKFPERFVKTPKNEE